MIYNDSASKGGKQLVRWLELLDRELADQAVPIEDRPLKAAMLLASSGIAIGPQGRRDDYLSQDWFAGLYHATEEWYTSRYGSKAKELYEASSIGLLLIHHTPYQLKIPLTTIEIEEPGKSAWVGTPGSVGPDEQVLRWVVDPPSLSKISADELESLKAEIRRLGGLHRSIWINLSTASLPEAADRRMATDIEGHISDAVMGICSLEAPRLSKSIWELFFAVEKSLKLNLRQRGRGAPRTHNLVRLYRELDHLGMAPIGADDLAVLPSEREAVKHRYSEVPPPTVGRAAQVYGGALSTVERCSAALGREVEIKGAKFLVARAPWIR